MKKKKKILNNIESLPSIFRIVAINAICSVAVSHFFKIFNTFLIEIFIIQCVKLWQTYSTIPVK